MHDNSYRPLRFALAAAALLIGGCTVSDASKQSADTAQPATGAVATPSTAASSAQPAAPATSDSARTGATAGTAQSSSTMRVEVDLAARKLYLYEGGNRVETHSVAVGSPQWPT